MSEAVLRRVDLDLVPGEDRLSGAADAVEFVRRSIPTPPEGSFDAAFSS